MNLFVGLGCCFYLSLLVCPREDTEGDGYSGFKVQVGDLFGARVLSSTTFRLRAKGRSRRFLLLFFLQSERKEGRRSRREMLASVLDSLVQVQAGRAGKYGLCWVEGAVGFVIRSNGRKGGEVAEKIIGREEIGELQGEGWAVQK